MFKRRFITNEDDQFSISPLIHSSKRLRKSNPTWNLKTFAVDKKALFLNEAQDLIGTIENQIIELGKPVAQYTVISSARDPLPTLKSEFRLQTKEEQLKIIEKSKVSDKKTSKKQEDPKKSTDTFSTPRINIKGGRPSNDKLRLLDRNLIKLVDKSRKSNENSKKPPNSEDISEFLNGDLKHLYYRVNKKSEESRKLVETSSLVSVQTRQKIEFLEFKVAKLKSDLINPGYKSTQILKESIMKPKKINLFEKIQIT